MVVANHSGVMLWDHMQFNSVCTEDNIILSSSTTALKHLNVLFFPFLRNISLFFVVIKRFDVWRANFLMLFV